MEKKRDGFEKGMELESASLSSLPAVEGGEVMSHLGKRLSRSLPWLYDEKDKVAKYQNRSYRHHRSEKSFFHILSPLGRKKIET